MAHVLVVEDEPNLRLLIARVLRDAGYVVSEAANGIDGMRAALDQDHDLILLDLMLPDIAGEQVLHVLLGTRPGARIMVLSSVAEVGRRVAVLDGGAVDFVAKPFVNAELLARVRARIRGDAVPETSSAEPRYLANAGTRLDLRRRELIVDGVRTLLSHREFVLLAHLMHRHGQVCTRQELLSDVWGFAFDPGTNVVDVYVRRLRMKLTASRIETVRNVGYRFVA
jgi:two-component system OmpR family response regulator